MVFARVRRERRPSLLKVKADAPPLAENTWLKALLVNGTPQPLNSPSPLDGDAGGPRSGPNGKR